MTAVVPPRNGRRMRWEEMLLGLFEDLEQQAEGLALSERDIEVAELSRAEYTQVTLEDRLHASIQRRVTLGVAGVGTVMGVLVRAGTDWCLVTTLSEARSQPTREWVIRVDAVQRAAGLSDRALGEASRPLAARLGVGSVLRGIAAERSQVRAHLRDGTILCGHLGRVGADFLELSVREGESWQAEDGPPRRELVRFAALAGLRRH